MYKSAKLIDIKEMPGYEYREGFKGLTSITDGKINIQPFSAGHYPSCIKHGAINCVAVRQDGSLWRCRELGCEEGCFIPKNQ